MALMPMYAVLSVHVFGFPAVLLPAGTVCLTTRAPIGHVAIAANELTTNQGFKNFVPSQWVDSQYLAQYLLASTDLLKSMASGTTFLELSKSRAQQVPFPLPPLEEQKEIARILDSALARVDRVNELVALAVAQLAAMKRQLVAAALAGKL